MGVRTKASPGGVNSGKRKGSGSRTAPQRRREQPEAFGRIRREMEANGVSRAAEMVFRNLTVRAETLQPQENGELLFTAVVASENPVKRQAYDWDEGSYVFQEILDMAGCNLERGSIIPMLRDHISWKVENQIGDWTNFRLDPNDATKMLADGRIAADDDAKIIRERVAAGIVKTFSCAYTIEDIEEEDDDGKVLRVTDWTMYEVSAVAVPADAECTIRALGAVMKGDSIMGVKRDNQPGGPNSGKGAGRGKQAPKADTRTQAEIDADLDAEDELDANDDLDTTGEGGEDDGGDDDTVVASDEQRSGLSDNDKALTRRAATIGIPRSYLRGFLGTSATPKEMTRKFREFQGEQDAGQTAGVRNLGLPATPIQHGSRRQGEFDAVIRAAAETSAAAHEKRAANYTADMRAVLTDSERGMTPKEVMRYCMKRHNYRYHGDISDMTGRDFMEMRAAAPMVIADFTYIANLVLQMGKLDGPEAIKYWGESIARKMEFTSFNAGQFTTEPEFDTLLETPHGSEIKRGTMQLWDTKAVPVTYNRSWPLTRQLFTMSGTGIFSSFPQGIANAGVTAENDALIDKLKQNPIMSDKVPFFHGSRYNVATGVPMDRDGIGMIHAVSMQKGAGIPYTGVIANPRHAGLWKSLSKRYDAQRLEDDSPFGGEFTPIFVPGFPKNAHLWFTDPRQRAFLLRMVAAGQPTPLTKIVETAQFDGFELVASLDRGIAHGTPKAAFLAFTDEEPDTLPDGEDANYEADDIETVLDEMPQ